MLSRYDGGADPVRRDPGDLDPRQTLRPAPPTESRQGYIAYERSVVPTVPRGMGRPIRSRDALRRVVVSLESLNADRSARAESQRQRLLTDERQRLEEARSLWRVEARARAEALDRQRAVEPWSSHLELLSMNLGLGSLVFLIAVGALRWIDFDQHVSRQVISLPGLILAAGLGACSVARTLPKWLRVRRVVRRREHRWQNRHDGRRPVPSRAPSPPRS